MGNKGVSCKLIKHYGEMTDGGRSYNKTGLSKNKMSLGHLLKITKQVIEEDDLNDEAASIQESTNRKGAGTFYHNRR